jgi:hypothetical protein
MPEERFFYHSFPRPKPGESEEDLHRRGLRILSVIAQEGFVLAPEILKWKQPLQDGGVRELELVQKRVCFTELALSELSGHAQQFGPFALEFDQAALRHLGAIPVFYIPQTLDPESASATATSLVMQLCDARFLAHTLQDIQSLVEQLRSLEKAGNQIPPTVQLTMTGPAGNVEKEASACLQCIEALCTVLTHRMAPFKILDGNLWGVLNMFYPTDNTFKSERLDYYRQREWRIISGITMRGTVSSSILTTEQKSTVEAVDPPFWGRRLDLKDPYGRLVDTQARVDLAEVLSGIGDYGVVKSIKSIIIPERVRKDAEQILPDHMVRTLDMPPPGGR